MFKNFLKIAFRNLWRYKGFAAINIAGLALGLTACLLIGLFVRDEKEYDIFLKEGDQVYRVYNEYTDEEGTSEMAVAPPTFAATLKQEFPEVQATARVMMQPEYKRLFEAGTVKIYEQSGYYVDSNYFDVFPLPFIHGSPLKALDNPNSIVISEEMAQRFFGNANPIGKEMLMEKEPLMVRGVFQKNPKFHLQFDFVLPLSAAGVPAERMQDWGWQQFINYVKVRKGTDVALLESKFQKTVNEKIDLFEKEGHALNTPSLQPLKDIHLYSSAFKFDLSERGNITYVKALTIIAIFILLIACFNFVNLATAKSMQRAREVGVRKSIGANRKQLIIQFLGETVLLSFISILISIGLVFLLIPWLNDFTGKHIAFDVFTNPVVGLILILLTLMVGVIAGFYPALVLSGFQPVKVLKGAAVDTKAGKTPWLRHSLVIVQFSLSVLLIISALVVFKQVNYLHNKDLGFQKEQIMFFPMRGERMTGNSESFKNELLNSPGVSAVSIGYGFPGDAVAGDGIMVPRNGEKKEHPATQLMVDHDYIKTLGLQVIAGRDFSREMTTDLTSAFIINETAVKELGFGTPEKALGQKLSWHPWGAQDPDSMKVGQVIGVLKDFHYKTLYDKVETAVLQIFPSAAWKVAVKLKTADMKSAIAGVNRTWEKFSPEYPLEYKFLDENFDEVYKSEDKLKSLLWIFTGVAIFVGCLGLFGLAAYAAQRRIKEIGIRKVLGASIHGIVVLLSKDFLKLVLIALVIASPIAWYFLNKWLQAFAYQIDIGWWVFVLAAIIAVVIALLTVSFQAIKAAVANPVKSLRTE